MLEARMNTITMNAVFGLAFATPLFFWSRGIVRGSKGDLAAGIVILVIFSFYSLVGSCDMAGNLFGLFGVATIVAGRFAKPDCPIQKRNRTAIAALFIILFILSGLMS